MNYVNLTGIVCRVGKPTEKGVMSFVLAPLGEKNNFVTIKAFKKDCDFLTKYLKPKMRVGITGKVSSNSYKDKNGNTIYALDIVYQKCEFLEKKKDLPEDPAEASVKLAPKKQN